MAITYDTTSTGMNATDPTSLTWSHTTTTASDRVLIVGTSTESDTGGHTAQTVSGITYAGAALTKVRTDYITDNGTELWYKIAPATGANDIVVTMTGTVDGLFGAGLTFSGVDQTTPIDNHAGTTTTGTSISQALTTNVADAMIVNIMQHYNSSAVLTPDANQTQRFNTPTTGDNDQAGGTRLVTTATSYTTSWTADISDGMTLSVLSLKPSGTNITVNAGVQSATFSTINPTVSAIKNKTVSPSVQSSAFSAVSPTITTTKNPTVSPSVQSATASQPSIQITVGDGVSAGVQSATFNAISPAITATRNPTVSLGVQSGVLSQISPSVTVTSNKTVSPTVQSATFTQQNITVTPIKNVSVALGVQSATFSQPSLGLTVGDGATPSVQSATFSAVSPTITTVQNRTVSTGVQSATFNLISPSVTTTTSKTVSLNVQSGVFSQPTPTITPVKNVSKAVGVQSAVFSQINPTVTAENSADSVTVSPSVQSKTFSAISPTVTTVRNVTWNAPVINLGYPKFIFDDKINLYKHITGRIYMKL